jgi:uncharacterized protein YgiM (DUF1202 family)
MKKVLIIATLIICAGFFAKSKIDAHFQEEELIKGWYIEITNSYINIRKEPNAYSSLLGEAKKGDKYKVLKVNLDNLKYFWYYVQIDSKHKGWIASERKNMYLKDNNNPTDIAYPVLKFSDDTYYVSSIDDINYKHLEITDDKKDFKVTHKVYKETKEDMYQYWIVYKVVDGAGHTVSKTQKIIFENEPKDSEVYDFNTLEK